jgi:SAM-dependent methyltransferase
VKVTHPITDSKVAELLDSFLGAEEDGLEPAYRRLTGALWTGGAPARDAAGAVPELVAALQRTGAPDRRGRLLVLLGVLAGTEEPPGGPVHAAVRAGLGHYLDLLADGAAGEPQTLALLYLLSHFPDDRDRIMPVASTLGLPAEDLSRLDRALEKLDTSDPAAVSLGRTWPSPAEWSLMSGEEREFDRGWISRLTEQQLAGRWDDDTVMIRVYLGGQAHWALRNGRPTATRDSSTLQDARDLPEATDSRVELFDRHADILRCADCGGELLFDDADVRCFKCGIVHPIRAGLLDLLPAGSSMFGGADHAMATAATMKTVGHYYETVARPGFLRLVGSNWDGAVTPADEDAYIADRMATVTGPVLDLGAGAGRWTTVIEKVVGPERLLALDPNPIMLAWLRRRSPDLACLQASALALPFTDGSLGAVNCWNALQAMPDARAALLEAGRCLRPGGILTLMTYQLSPDPLYRHFQTTSSWPGHPNGLDLYDRDRITGWLAEAGLTVREADEPGAMLLLTAERTS